MARKKQTETTSSIDWARIRKRFEATTSKEISGRDLAADFGITEGTIRARAKAEGWLRRDQREKLQSSIAREGISPTDTPTIRAELSAEQVDRISTLWQRTSLGVNGIAEQLGISIVDVDFCIHAHPDWKKYAGEGASKDADPPRSADASAVAALRSAAPGAAAPVEPAPTKVPFEREHIRSPIRELDRRDNPPIVQHRARKLKPSQIVEIARDAAEALVCQIRDAIGNRDSLMDMIEEWNRDHDGEPGAGDKYEAMKKALSLKELGLALKNASSAAKSLFDQQEGASGKKEQRKEEAAIVAETSRFKKRSTPKLATAGGERV